MAFSPASTKFLAGNFYPDFRYLSPKFFFFFFFFFSSSLFPDPPPPFGSPGLPYGEDEWPLSPPGFAFLDDSIRPIFVCLASSSRTFLESIRHSFSPSRLIRFVSTHFFFASAMRLRRGQGIRFPKTEVTMLTFFQEVASPHDLSIGPQMGVVSKEETPLYLPF